MDLKQFVGKVIYVAGPYSGDDEDPDEYVRQRDENVKQAREVAIKLWKIGAAAICPHMNSYNFEGYTSYENFILGYLEIMKRADVVLALPGWRESDGARLELALAERLGMEIVEWEARDGDN